MGKYTGIHRDENLSITQMKLTTFKYIYAMSKARILLLYYFIQDLPKFNTDISVISVT